MKRFVGTIGTNGVQLPEAYGMMGSLLPLLACVVVAGIFYRRGDRRWGRRCLLLGWVWMAVITGKWELAFHAIY